MRHINDDETCTRATRAIESTHTYLQRVFLVDCIHQLGIQLYKALLVCHQLLLGVLQLRSQLQRLPL